MTLNGNLCQNNLKEYRIYDRRGLGLRSIRDTKHIITGNLKTRFLSFNVTVKNTEL